MKKVKIPFSLDEYNKGGYEVETDVAGYHTTILKTDAKGNEPIIGLCLMDEYEVPLAFNKKGEIANNSLNLVLIKYEFEDGDIVYTRNYLVEMISIFKSLGKKQDGSLSGTINVYATLSWGDKYKEHLQQEGYVDGGKLRFATNEEKQKLFDMLATEKCLKWNDETKDFESISNGSNPLSPTLFFS